MKLRILHRTAYEYGSKVLTSHHDARLTPRESEAQRTISHRLTVTPHPALFRRRLDYFGNRVAHFALSEPHLELAVEAESLVELNTTPSPELSRSPAWERIRDALRTDRHRDALDAYQMAFASPHVPVLSSLAEYAAPSFGAGRPLLEAAHELNRRIHGDFIYDPTATVISTPLSQVLAQRSGVCQDFAHLMIGCLRALGLPARYVSGYLRTLPAPGQERLIGADASHAWVAVWVPERGWIDFDPTNDLMPSFEHVTAAVGRDFSDVTPIRGIIHGGGAHQHTVTVDVEEVA